MRFLSPQSDHQQLPLAVVESHRGPSNGLMKRREDELLKPTLACTEDGGVLLDLEHDRLLKLNPTAVELWRAIEAGKREAEIVEETAREQGVDPEQVRRDLRGLQDRVMELGLRIPMVSIGTEVPRRDDCEALPNFPWYASNGHAAQSPRQRFRTACAFLGLLVFDCILSMFSMKSLCWAVKSWPSRRRSKGDDAFALERTCKAAECACVWYPKKALCLQRSAVTTCLLRLAGLPAKLVIGAQAMPFQAHAWVEVRGQVVNDHPGVTRVYRVLTRY